MNSGIHERKNILLLLLGRTVSSFGSAFYLIALPLYMLQRTGSLAQTGLFFTLSSLPALLLTPFLGVLVEKVNRKRLLVGCDGATAAVYGALLAALGRDSFLPVLFGGTLTINVLSNAFEIGSKLMFTEVTTPETIERYNGVKSLADNAAAVTAPALGTIVFGRWGFGAVLAIAAAAYALSALQECFIRYQRPENAGGAEKRGWLAQFWEGVRYVTGERDILPLFILAMALNFFVANSEEIINPGILVQKYGISEELFGMTSSAAVAGTLAAGVFIYKNRWIDLRKNFSRFILLNGALMILTGIGSLCMTAVPGAYFTLFLLVEFFIGAVTSFVNVPLFSSFQTQVPLVYQGRFFALLSFSARLLVPLGISYTGFLASLVGADVAYILNNICVILVVLLYERPARRERKNSGAQ